MSQARPWAASRPESVPGAAPDKALLPTPGRVSLTSRPPSPSAGSSGPCGG